MKLCDHCELPVVINQNTTYIEDVFDDTGQRKVPICKTCVKQLDEARILSEKVHMRLNEKRLAFEKQLRSKNETSK